MNASSRWPLSNAEQDKLIRSLTENLLLLRAKLDISQEEIAKLIGISRQTYSSIENEKRPMSWQTYLSLILFFDVNETTHSLLHHLECFPDVLVDKTQITTPSKTREGGDANSDILEMLSKLDDQAMHSVRTVLMVEYARCSKISGEAVVKAFNGTQFNGTLTTDEKELGKAIKNIKMRANNDGS